MAKTINLLTPSLRDSQSMWGRVASRRETFPIPETKNEGPEIVCLIAIICSYTNGSAKTPQNPKRP